MLGAILRRDPLESHEVAWLADGLMMREAKVANVGQFPWTLSKIRV
jgi:hypothetical protein